MRWLNVDNQTGQQNLYPSGLGTGEAANDQCGCCGESPPIVSYPCSLCLNGLSDNKYTLEIRGGPLTGIPGSPCDDNACTSAYLNVPFVVTRIRDCEYAGTIPGCDVLSQDVQVLFQIGEQLANWYVRLNFPRSSGQLGDTVIYRTPMSFFPSAPNCLTLDDQIVEFDDKFIGDFADCDGWETTDVFVTAGDTTGGAPAAEAVGSVGAMKNPCKPTETRRGKPVIRLGGG